MKKIRDNIFKVIDSINKLLFKELSPILGAIIIGLLILVGPVIIAERFGSGWYFLYIISILLLSRQDELIEKK
jgi:hypothetical protein